MTPELPRQILGWLGMAPHLIEAGELSADDFPAGRYRRTFEAMSRIWEDDKPGEITLAVLAERIGGNGAASFIASLVDGLQKPTPENFAVAVREMKTKTVEARIEKKLRTQAEATGIDIDEIQADLQELARLKAGAAAAFDPYAFMRTGSQLQALDIHVDWIVEKLIPERAITLLHGVGGLGKTWLCLALAKAISEGTSFLGLRTKQRDVIYIDYENPLTIMHDRARTLDVCQPRFWHLSDPTRPPRLDGPDWKQLKALHPGSLVIIDTARGATEGDEIKGEAVALVMNRLKEIRELGHEIILQAHTSKADRKRSKGATTWEDLSDHTLAFYRVDPKTRTEIEDEGYDPNAQLYLGTGNKTRFEPCRLFVSLDAATGTFSLAEDPVLTAIDAIADYIAGPGRGKSQSEIIAWTRDAGIGPGMRETFIALLARGEREGRWQSYKDGRKRIYAPRT